MSITPSDPTSGGGNVIDGLPCDRPLIRKPRRLLPCLVICYGIGLILGARISADPILPCTFAGVLLLLGLLRPDVGCRFGAVYLALMALGWAHMATHPDVRAIQHFGLVIGQDKQHVELVGRIDSSPIMMPAGEDGRVPVQADLRVEAIRRGHNMLPLEGKLRMRIYENGEARGIRYGDRWELSGVLYVEDRPLERSRGYSGFLDAHAGRSRFIESRKGNMFKSWCYALRTSCYDRLGLGVDPDMASASLPRALLLGYRDDVPDDVYQAFSKTGTLHVLALSGMHVGILVLLVVFVLRLFGVYRTWWAWILIPFLAMYAIATGAASSTVRAAVMASVFFASYVFRREADAPTSMALAALIILLSDPLQVFDAGFILSFTVVTGLLVLYPKIMSLLLPAGPQDAWADPESGWLASRRAWWKRVVEMFGISLAAWLASLPLIASLFHLISPAALLVNMLLLPLAALILALSCMALTVSVFSVWTASLVNIANTWLCEGLIKLIQISSGIPGSHFYVKEWWAAAIVLWYALLIFWAVKKRYARVAAAGVIVTMIGLSIFGRHLNRSANVSVFAAGRTNVVLIDGPGDHAALIDTGSSYTSRALIDALRKRGISSVDIVIFSRATVDAYGGNDALSDTMRINLIVTPEVSSRQKSFSESVSRWQTANPDVEVTQWKAMREFDLPGCVRLQLLFPPAGESYRSANASSLIARISKGYASVLFMGYAGERIEREAVSQPVDWDADVLVVGKCGEADALSPEWLELVCADSVVFNDRAFDRSPESTAPIERRLRNASLRTQTIPAGSWSTIRKL